MIFKLEKDFLVFFTTKELEEGNTPISKDRKGYFCTGVSHSTRGYFACKTRISLRRGFLVSEEPKEGYFAVINHVHALYDKHQLSTLKEGTFVPNEHVTLTFKAAKQAYAVRLILAYQDAKFNLEKAKAKLEKLCYKPDLNLKVYQSKMNGKIKLS